MNENPFGVRLATEADAPALLHFVLPIYVEGAAQTVSEAKVAALVERCTARERGIAGIITGPIGIEASVGMTIDEADYSDESHVMVRWLGVSPAVRRSGLGARLMGFVKWFHMTLSAMDAPMPVFLSSLVTTDLRSKVLLLQRQAPMVGVVHALGVLPHRAFLSPWQVAGPKRSSDGSSRKGLPSHVRNTDPIVAVA
jgi:hypothetical protein